MRFNVSYWGYAEAGWLQCGTRPTMSEKNNTRFEIASSIMVFVSIAIMALETFALPDILKEIILAVDIALSLVFVAEYIFRVTVAENKREYVTSFYGIIDLVAIFPLLIPASASVRVVRLLRVLRVIRLLKISRYTIALDNYKQALKLIVAEVALFTVVALVFIISFAFVIYELEHEVQPDVYRNIFDSFWWATISLTSVGYGDIYPVTVAGRILTLVMVLTGMGIVAVPTALLASALSKVRTLNQSDDEILSDGVDG